MRGSVKALTLAATLLTTQGALAEEVVGPPNPYAEETPLELRAAKPLVVAQEPSGTSPLTKLALCGLVVMAGAAFVLKKRQRAEPKRDGIQVLSRTSVGVRSEVMLIEAAGQRLLVGVTPSSMRTLAMLPIEPVLSDETVEAPAAAAVEPLSLSPNFDRLLASARKVREREAQADLEASFFAQGDADDEEEQAPPPPVEKPRARAPKKASREPRQIALAMGDDDAAEGQVVALARLRRSARR